MINKIKCRLLQMYGNEENEKNLRYNTLIAILILCVIFYTAGLALPTLLRIYFNALGGAMIALIVSLYYFRKKKNRNKYKRLKVYTCFACFAITLVIAFPALSIIIILNIFADVTDKIYVIKRNFTCFLVELVYHLGFITMLVRFTMLHSNNVIYLLITYTLFLLGDKFLCELFRIIFITGKNKNYERYRYSKEVDIISEYAFLAATVVSILCSASEYSLVFVPIMLWYALKQIRTYRIEKKNSNYISQFLISALHNLKEIDDIFLEAPSTESIAIKEYFSDNDRLEGYISYNSNKGILYYFTKKRTQAALTSINDIMLNEYKIPEEKKQAKEDLEMTMNNIVKCIS